MSQSRTVSVKKAWSMIMMLLLSVLLTVSVLSLSAPMTVHAANNYDFNLDHNENIEIIIQYKGDKAPGITVKGPSKTYSKDADYAKAEKQKGILYYYLKDAPQGKWTIQSTAEIDFTVLVWYEQISVSSFTVSQPKNDRVTVKTTINSSEEKYFDWYIYATAKADITGSEMKTELRRTSGSTGKENSVELDISHLPDGEWQLSMDAVVDYGNDLTSEAHAVADKPLQIKGHTQQGDSSKIVTRADATTQTMYVDWSAVEDNYQKMLVSAVDKDGELLIYDEFDKSVTNTDFLAKDEVTLRLMPIYQDTYQVMYTLKLSYGGSVKVTIDTPEVTGDLMVTVSYETGDKTVPADIVINGKTNRYQLSGTSSLSLPLEPMTTNEVSVTYYPSDNEQYTVSKSISVQSAPAFIEFYGVTDKLVTDRDSIVIAGKTTPDAALKLNGEEVKVEAEGEFAAEAKLASGENALRFSIESPFGIRTERVVTVIRTEAGSSAASVLNQTEIPFWVQLVFAVVLILVTAGGVILTIMLIKKRKLTSFAAVLLAVRMFLLFAAILSALAGSFCLYQCIRVSNTISGEHLIERLETNDYDGLHQVLSVRDAWIGRTITTLILAVVAAVLFVLLTVFGKKLLKKLQNRKQKPKKPKKPKQPKAPKQPKEKRAVFAPQPYPQNAGNGQYPPYPQDPQNAGNVQYPQYPQNPQNAGNGQYPQYPQNPQNAGNGQYPQYPQNPQNAGNGQYPQYPQNPQNAGNGQYPPYPQNPQG